MTLPFRELNVGDAFTHGTSKYVKYDETIALIIPEVGQPIARQCRPSTEVALVSQTPIIIP